MSVIDLSPEYLKMVREILNKHLPEGTPVWLFGSRAKGKAKKFSDIDLMLEADSEIPANVLIDLGAEFDESSIPYKVDLVQAVSIDSGFLERIRQEGIQIAGIEKK